MAKPTWDDTEEIEDIPKFEDTLDIEETEAIAPEEASMLESAGRGAVQGATFGLADEIGAAALSPLEMIRAKIAGLIPGTPENVDAELREQGFTGDIEEQGLIDKYKEFRDTSREADKEAEEANPYTYMGADIAGGVIPALATGGGAAAAKVGTTLGKEAVKDAAKLGAKYGAVSGLGYGESDLTEGDVSGVAQDVGLGATIGAGAGVALPAALKGAKDLGSKALKGTKELIEAVTPEAGAIKAGYQFGKEGKKLTQDVVDEDMKKLASDVLDRIKNAKNEVDLKNIKQELDDFGIKVDTEEAFNTAIDDIQKIVNDDVLDISNKQLLPKLQNLAGVDTEALKMANKAEKKAIQKALESQSKQEQAIIKAEKGLAKDQIKSGDDLERILDLDRKMNDLEIPLSTPEGSIGGAKGVFKGPDGEEYSKAILSDTTPYQPKISKILGPDGRPIVQTKDLGSGKITAMIGDINSKVEKNLAEMSVSEVESIRKQINVLTKMAKNQGTEGDPVIQRAKALAVKLRDLTDEAVEKGAKENDKLRALDESRKRMSDILSAEDLLGTSRTKAVEAGAKKNEQIRNLSEKLSFNKGFKTRDEASEAIGKLGDDVLPQGDKDRFELFKELNAVMGRESQENISRAGLYKKAVGDVPNLAGRAVKKVGDIADNKLAPVVKAKKSITDMADDELSNYGTQLASSSNKGLQDIGQRLLDAVDLEGTAKKQLLWSLSQSPVMREIVKRQASDVEEDEQAIFNGQSEDLPEIKAPLYGDSQAISDSVSTSQNAPVRGDTISPESSRGPASVESQEETSSYLRPQTSGVNLDVDESMLNTVEEIGRKLGYDNLTISSGKRDKAKTEEILEQRKEQYGLDDFESEEDQALIDKLLLRGDSPENIEYSSRADVNKVLEDNFPDQSKDLIEKFRQVRLNFGGYQSPHLQGKKIDIPYSFFVNQYGLTEGKKKAKEMIKELKEAGLKVIDEKNAGQYGVIDIQASEMEPSQNMLDILKPYAEQEPEQLETAPSEDQIDAIEASIDMTNKMMSSGDGTPVDELEVLLEKINSLNVSEEIIDELEDEAMDMRTYSQGLALKEKLRRLIG